MSTRISIRTADDFQFVASRCLLYLGAILFVLCISLNSHADNLLVNGSFEDTTGHNWQGNGSWMRVYSGGTAITGWTVGGGCGVDWHNSTELKPIENGTYAVDLNCDGTGISNTGTLSQTFATTAGQKYELTFYLAGPEPCTTCGFPDPRLVNVNINGTDYVLSQPASSNLAIQWGLKTVDFTASSSSSMLTFSSLNGTGYWGPVLDNASVEAVGSTVPEPASFLLLGSGMALISGLLRPRKVVIK